MRTFRQVIYGLFAAAMVAGCTSDLPGDDPNKLPEDDGNGFFMALDIQMPTGTVGSRSETTEPDDNGTTSSGGTEVGTPAENTVTTALIVLAAKEAKGEFEEFGLIATGMVQNNRISSLNEAGNKQYRATARLQKANLTAFYQDYGVSATGHEVYVFVFCNPTSDLLSTLESAKLGKKLWMKETICEVYQNSPGHLNTNIGIWGTNSFLMNNVSLATRLLPGNLDYWENCNTVDNAFHLSQNNTGEGGVDNSKNPDTGAGGAVKVERSVARFDFKDGSDKDNTYNVLSFGNEGNEKPVVSVQLQKMCLVNMSTKFYYLPRVSDDGTPDGTRFAYCAPELPWTHANGFDTGGNYVVGPNWEKFNATLTENYYEYFNFPFFADTEDELVSFDNGNWDVVKISDVLAGQEDDYDGQHNYHIWRYVTENVIPAGPENQRNSVSTGVVFKAKLNGLYEEGVSYDEAYWNKGYIKNLSQCLNGESGFTYEGEADHPAIKGETNKDPILYYYDGHLYMGWRHIRQAAIQAAVTINTAGAIEINRSNSLFKAVFGTDGVIPPSYNFGGKSINTVYMVSATESKELVDPMWETNKAIYENSADCAWQNWYDAGKPEEPTNSDATNYLLNMRLALTDAGITLYQSSKDDDFGAGYYCYYYYWNRHNDNGIPGTMGPMEFAVVRNNVYKLSVKSISRLGHPRIPENDPDNPTPTTPDESDRIYLDVQVEIVPWVVRVNDIVF